MHSSFFLPPVAVWGQKPAHTDVYAALLKKLAVYDAIKPAVEVPPYGQGRKEYKAPKEWKITEQ